MPGCLNAGICLKDGVGGLPKNVKDSIGYFEKSCNGKNPIACVSLFKIFLDGSNDIPKDTYKAFEYTKKACELNDMFGCWNAYLMLKKGDGIPKDEQLSKEYWKKFEDIKKDHEKAGPEIVMGEQHK